MLSRPRTARFTLRKAPEAAISGRNSPGIERMSAKASSQIKQGGYVMKTTGILLSMLAGVAIGAIAVEGLHAQAKPPVYMIAENDLTNPEGYAKEYVPLAQASIKAHGGRHVAAGKPTPLEGPPPKERVVILVWNSLEQLQAWRNSPDYREARKTGEKYAKFRQFAVDGVAQ
jgi:uncharacterized protein (DUF1330 family)